MNLDTTQALKAYFPAEEHLERKLPGGGRLFYIPWQQIRERLDQACPDWSCEYSDPMKLPDGETVIRCKITIEGCTREGVGVAPVADFNDSGKRKGIGSPVEVAIADAFKNAAEQFGVGAYIDNQKELVRYLQSKMDGRGVKFYQENDWKEHGAMGRPKNSTSAKNQIKPKSPALDFDACIKYAESKGLSFERAEEIIVQCNRDREAIFNQISTESSAIATK
jgi:hypothetical protein